MTNTLIILLLCVPALALLVAQIGGFSGKRPADIGITSGRLKPPSNTRNSVSSQAPLYPDHAQKDAANIAPLTLKSGSAEVSIQTLLGVLQAMPGITVVEQKPDYLYAEAQTRWLKFVDDVEFWLNPERGVIEVRSASRLGKEDLGANRKRIEAIRAAYLAQP
ncbi:DUF1499 domain-containing protein [Hydrogenophaga sp.]|uniref:DUF1499 domain-containing protein n=1 Tax=Hydrogenophaga sp. TaxID=1904254 RepID=UPI00356B3C2F